MRQLGADQFVAYDEEDAGVIFENQADTVIDATKGGRAGESGMQIMKEGGNFVACQRNKKNLGIISLTVLQRIIQILKR